MNHIASRIAGVQPPTNSEVDLEVDLEDELGVETTYETIANVHWDQFDNSNRRNFVEFYDFKRKDTGEEIDEGTFWGMFDKDDLIVMAIEKAESPADFMAEYGDYLYDQEKDRKIFEKP